MFDQFYSSAEWRRTRAMAVALNIQHHGILTCELCHRPILKEYDCIVHHKTELTRENIYNPDITLNQENLQCLHAGCHNKVHGDRRRWTRKVYLVHGSPKAGKTTYVDTVALPGDLVIDVGRLWASISFGAEHTQALTDDVLRTRDFLIDRVATRANRNATTYVVGTYPFASDRERLARRLDAELVHIDTPMDVCLSRCADDSERKLVDRYWRQFSC